MSNSLTEAPIAPVLTQLFAEADHDGAKLNRLRERFGSSMADVASAELSDAMADVVIPVSPECGALLYALVRAARPSTVVEFGTSFGISTIYLAAAVRDNGAGRVVTTELSAVKAARARAHLASAGLGECVELREGDALHTLAELSEPVGLVLLDGWKPLCLPVLRRLEPVLAPGALVLADDTTAFPDQLGEYLGYVREPANGYVSVDFPVADGVELSCRV